MTDAPPPAQTDDTDWTFVIEEGCGQCGCTPHDVATTPQRLRVWGMTGPRVLDG